MLRRLSSHVPAQPRPHLEVARGPRSDRSAPHRRQPLAAHRADRRARSARPRRRGRRSQWSGEWRHRTRVRVYQIRARPGPLCGRRAP